MNKLATCHKALPIAILLALLVCGNSQTSSAQSSGGLSASASGSLGGSNGGISGQVGADASLAGSSSGSAQAQISGSLGSGSGGGLSLAAGSTLSGSESSAAAAAAGSASLTGSALSYVSSTPKPEGLFSKMKEIVKTSVDSLTGDSKKDNQDKEQKSAGASMSASASLSGGGGGESGKQKSEGLMDKLGDAAKKGKDLIKETAKGVKEDVKSILKPGESGGSASATGSVKLGATGVSADARVQVSGGAGASREGPIAKLMNKGQEMVHKIESKASEFGKEIAKPLTGGGSGEGVRADAQVKIGGAGASVKAQVGSSRDEEKSLAVEVLEKMHEMSRAPVEQAMKPIDKALGVKEDPLVKVMDQTESMLRKPVSELAKPVESILSGAFHTSEEARAEQERAMSEQERREVRLREERARKEGRSVLGQITDKTVELAEKPFEVVMNQIGMDKKGEKNPLVKLIDEIYGLSKKPIDAVAKPLEDILRRMADGGQGYQLSVRYAGSDTDPKLFTRLADGALNIADRVVTRPIEFVMRPLGYDKKNNRNPIVDATHSLKNATKIGLELFMKPIDRIIKEIAEIGDIRDEAEREAEIQRRRQDASRIVAALDKLHELAEAPFEIVLKPIGKVLGYNKEGRKEPVLRAWDIAHEVAMVPLQVLGKPLEDAILGERRRPKLNVKSEVKVGQGQTKVTARASVSGAQGGGAASASSARGAMAERRKNFFVESIKKMEKFATKPIEVVTSPVRKLILGEDDKIGAGSKKFQAKAKLGPIQASANIQTSGEKGNQPDKIVKTIEKINDVVLRPLEVMTQPISDMVTTDDRKLKSKIDVKVQSSTQMRGQENAHASASAGVIKVPASGSAHMRVQENAHASMLAPAGGSKVSASGSVSGSGLGQAHASGSLATPTGSVSGSASVSG